MIMQAAASGSKAQRVTSGEPLVRAPKQERSRQSFDRVVDATVALLVDQRSFTLADVAAASGVSTGSIYGRISSKESLIRVAHAREMKRVSQETVRAFAADGDPPATLAEAVRFAVRALAALLERNARVLRAFMLLGHHDHAITEAGARAHAQMQMAFIALVGDSVRGVGAVSDSDLQWACTVAYSVLARQLGLGSHPGAAADYELSTVVDRLAEMLTAYLAEGC